MLANFRLRYQG